MAAVRAQHMKVLLGAFRRRASSGVCEAFFDRYADADRVAVESALSLRWLPFRINLSATHLIVELLGAEAEPFFRDLGNVQAGSTALKIFLDGISRTLGVTPASYLKIMPRAWSLLFRDIAVLRYEVEPRRGILTFEELCPEGQDLRWLESIGWGFESGFDLSRCAGTATLEPDFANARAYFHFAW